MITHTQALSFATIARLNRVGLQVVSGVLHNTRTGECWQHNRVIVGGGGKKARRIPAKYVMGVGYGKA